MWITPHIIRGNKKSYSVDNLTIWIIFLQKILILIILNLKVLLALVIKNYY